MAFNRPIFRKPALDKLNAPEQFDDLMQVTTLHSWIVLGAFGTIIFMVLIWGVWGKVTDTVDGQCELRPVDLSTLQAVAYIQAGDVERVEVGMPVQILPLEDAAYLQGVVLSVSSAPTRETFYEVRIHVDRQMSRVYRSGELCSVRIIVDETAPIQLLLGR